MNTFSPPLCIKQHGCESNLKSNNKVWQQGWKSSIAAQYSYAWPNYMSRQAMRVIMEIIKQKYIKGESCLAHPPATQLKTALIFQPYKDKELLVFAIVWNVFRLHCNILRRKSTWSYCPVSQSIKIIPATCRLRVTDGNTWFRWFGLFPQGREFQAVCSDSPLL